MLVDPFQELAEHITAQAAESSDDCASLLHELVTIPSPSRGERLAGERVMREMQRLGYSDVHIDPMGNVLGRVGSGSRVIAFDAHIDTVGISNPTQWRFDPFRGVVSAGILYGRGASDQKGGLAAIIHGVALAARMGLPDDFTLWVTASVNGEDCVGLAWQYLVREQGLRPETVVIAMPSHLGVCTGQRGRMEMRITVEGVSSHCSQPDRGENAIYAMSPIVSALQELHTELRQRHTRLGGCSIAVTEIDSRSPSLTAVPDECKIHLDRRLTLGECHTDALAEVQNLPQVQAANARVELLDYDLPSWRGLSYATSKVFPAWETPLEAPASQAALVVARTVLGREPRIHRSAFSSNGCATSGIFGIPTVGFGPADEIHSHSVDDQISLAQLVPAMSFYALYPTAYQQAQR